jgi:hypothetical protein
VIQGAIISLSSCISLLFMPFVRCHDDRPLLGHDQQCAFVRSLGTFNDKGGQATKFRMSNANFRLYKPVVSKKPNGDVLITASMDHVRAGKFDDHAELHMTISQACDLQQLEIIATIQGNEVGTASSGIIKLTSATLKGPSALIATALSTVMDKLIGAGDKKAVLVFKSAVAHIANKVVAAYKSSKCTCE